MKYKNIFITLLHLVFTVQIISQTTFRQQGNLVMGGQTFLIIRGVDPNTHVWTNTDADMSRFEIQLDEYVRRSSFNKAWVGNIDITPVYNFDANSPSGKSLDEQFRELATNDGYDLGSYNVIIFLHESSAIAGPSGTGNGQNGIIYYPNQFSFFTPGFIHEAFHSFGFGHAQVIEGGDAIFTGDILDGIDPYYFMGREGDAVLNSDIPSYMKYYAGWLDASNVEVVDLASFTATTSCMSYRIYKASRISSYDNSRAYGLQLGDFWLSYEPDNAHSNLQTKGMLIHRVFSESPAVSRLVDAKPNSITTLPPSLDSGWLSIIDFFDSAMTLGESILFDDDMHLTVVDEGGSGDLKWVDIEICRCTQAFGDIDNDNVCDAVDICNENSFVRSISAFTGVGGTVPEAQEIRLELSVSENNIIEDIDVIISVEDLLFPHLMDISLISPEGKQVSLLNSDVSGASGNFSLLSFGTYSNVTFDNESIEKIDRSRISFANEKFEPEEDISTFYGDNTSGNWTLLIKDSSNLLNGFLTGFSIRFCSLNTLSISELEDLEGHSLKVYPNPSDGVFKMSLSDDVFRSVDKDIEITVRDITGKVVFRKIYDERKIDGFNLREEEIDVKHLKSGVYIMSVDYSKISPDLVRKIIFN